MERFYQLVEGLKSFFSQYKDMVWPKADGKCAECGKVLIDRGRPRDQQLPVCSERCAQNLWIGAKSSMFIARALQNG